MSEKQCFKCGEVKSLAEFYKHKAMADGHLGKCKDCTKRDVRLHRRGNESVREYDRLRSKRPERMAASRANTERWQKAHPIAYKAQTAVGNAVRDGRLEKGPCEVCQSTSRIHAHHDDYSKPLEVRWLCAKHHHRHHASADTG